MMRIVGNVLGPQPAKTNSENSGSKPHIQRPLYFYCQMWTQSSVATTAKAVEVIIEPNKIFVILELQRSEKVKHFNCFLFVFFTFQGFTRE